jgi:hypothetical protein
MPTQCGVAKKDAWVMEAYIIHESGVLKKFAFKKEAQNTPYLIVVFIILQNRYNYVIFEVLTALVMKSSVFWDITPCSLKVNLNPVDFQRRP